MTGINGYSTLLVPAPTEKRNAISGAINVICLGWFSMAFAATDTIQSIPPETCISPAVTTTEMMMSMASTGALPGSNGYVRVYLYLGQSSNSLSGATQIAGEAEQFDFQQADLAGGSQTLQKSVVLPADFEGPFHIHAVVDGPEFWAESAEGNNLGSSSGLMGIWRPGGPLINPDFDVLARTAKRGIAIDIAHVAANQVAHAPSGFIGHA